MKIAVFVHCFFPGHYYGTETYTLDLARRLREMGHEATVVAAIFLGEPKQEQAVARYEYEGVPVVSIDKNIFRNRDLADTYYQPSMRPVLRGILDDLKPDLVHVTHLVNHTAVLLEEVKDLGIPLVATLTDFFGFCYTCILQAVDGSLCSGPRADRSNCVACWLKTLGTRPRASRLERAVIRGPWLGLAAAGLVRAARLPRVAASPLGYAVRDLVERPDVLARAYETYRAVITPTRFLREAYERNGLNVPMYDIRFGVDLPRHPKPVRSASAPLVIGYIGQIAPHKGVDLLVDSFAALGPVAAELHIFGPEDQNPHYMAKIRRAAAGRAVRFRGTFPKEKLAGVLEELDLLAIPSRWYENSPLVLLNALASHTPVLISDVAGMTEFVEHGKNGFIFERSDLADLSRTLREIVAAPESVRTMSQTTEYHRTTRTMVEDVLPIYRKVSGSI